MTTKELGKEALKTVLSIAGTVIGALLILSATDKFNADKDTEKELIRLDKEKASVIYVDQKCLDVRDANEKKSMELMNRLDRIELKQDKTLDYLLNQKK